MFDGRDVSEFEERYWECERMNEGNNGRGNERRFLRLVKVVFWSDCIELDRRSIVMWNGNVD